MKSKYHIVYLGCSGFPFGMAEVQKMTLISRVLVNEGHNVNIISNWTMFTEKDHPELKKEGTFHGINYHYSTNSPYRPEKSFSRKWQHFLGIIREFNYLRKLKKEDRLDFAILSTHKFQSILYYVLVSKFLGYKTILNYVEFYSGIKKKKSKSNLILNDYLFDNWCPRIVNANLPISEFLINHLNKIAPSKKYLKIPIITDYGKYNGIQNNNSEHSYFLFCGASIYINVVKFVIDAYSKLEDPKLSLHLVINGSQKKLREIKEYIAQSNFPERIFIFSKLSESELFNQYKNAAALLIPLRPSLQDNARFPHKIGEYLASGNPVISTNIGEVKFYFTHLKNMLIAERYDENDYAQQMQFVISNPEIARAIGKEGYDFGRKHFDYLLYGEMFNTFLGQLI